MEAKELRIGNYFIEENSKEIIQVIGLEKNKIVFHGNYLQKWQAIPIELTQEWLLKFGFKHTGRGHKRYLILKINEDCFIQVDTYLEKIILLTSKTLLGDTWTDLYHIKHVHQLQNLYFALTGKELKLINK